MKLLDMVLETAFDDVTFNLLNFHFLKQIIPHCNEGSAVA